MLLAGSIWMFLVYDIAQRRSFHMIMAVSTRTAHHACTSDLASQHEMKSMYGWAVDATNLPGL